MERAEQHAADTAAATSPAAGAGSSARRKRARKSAPVAGTPNPRWYRSCWEYPLTSAEKKHRVMCLYQAELADTQHRSERKVSALLDANESLLAQIGGAAAGDTGLPERPPPRRTSAPPRLRRGSPAGVCAQQVLTGRLARVACGLALGLLGGLAVCMSRSPPAEGPGKHSVQTTTLAIAASMAQILAVSPNTSGNEGLTRQILQARVGTSLSVIAAEPVSPNTTVAANTTLAVHELWAQGRERLSVSDCWKATEFFTGALDLLSRHAHDGSLAPVRDAVSRAMLLNDLGFALICTQQYREGAGTLERHLRGYAGLRQTPPHLTNALGFAHFHLENYKRASEVFEVAIQVDPMNPILWNNLAAARMVRGEIRAADDALYLAVDKSEPGRHILVEEYHRQVILSNVHKLYYQSMGDAQSLLPTVELWWTAN